MTQDIIVRSVSRPSVIAESFYTVPASRTCIPYSALGAALTLSPGNAPGSQSFSLGILRSGALDIDWIVTNLAIAAGGQTNMYVKQSGLVAGDKLYGRNATAGMGVFTSSDNTKQFGGKVLLSNTDGSILVGVTAANDIVYSLTRGLTWLTTAQVGIAAAPAGIFAGGFFYIYTSAINVKRSADGLNWTDVICVGAPGASVALINLMGNILKVGANYYFLKSSTGVIQVSTDLLNWAVSGVATAAGANVIGLAWTGTNMVTLSSAGGTGTIYYTANFGGAWSAVAGAMGANNGLSIASNGNGVLLACATATTLYNSTNHGATWQASVNGAASATSDSNVMIQWTGYMWFCVEGNGATGHGNWSYVTTPTASAHWLPSQSGAAAAYGYTALVEASGSANSRWALAGSRAFIGVGTGLMTVVDMADPYPRGGGTLAFAGLESF